MALQDILAAITAQADERIATARKEHQRTLTQLREESERRLAKKKQEIAVSKQQKMDQLTAKAHTRAQAQKRNAVLSKKKELLDRVFGKAVDVLCNVDADKAEKLLRACIKRITGKGSIHPSKKHADLLKKICPSEQFTMDTTIDAKGGFLFTSKTQECDFTMENIVEQNVRPKHELATATILFS